MLKGNLKRKGNEVWDILHKTSIKGKYHMRECSDEDRAPHDDGDGEYCMYCGNNIKRIRE